MTLFLRSRERAKPSFLLRVFASLREPDSFFLTRRRKDAKGRNRSSIAAFGGMTAAFVALTSPSFAQPQTAVAVESVDPGRLTAARNLMDVIMPPSQREVMMETMLNAVMQNVSNGIMQAPWLAEALKKEPRAQPIFQRFIDRQREASIKSLQENLPSMIEAMSRAYARRFTLVQLTDMDRFFRTASGQAYVTQAATIMSDPDLANWQREAMARDMGRVPKDIEALVEELKALKMDGGQG